MTGIKPKKVAILLAGILYSLSVFVFISSGLGFFPSLFYSVFIVLGFALFGVILISILWGLVMLIMALLEPVWNWLKK